MKKKVHLALITLFSISVKAQTIDHWEAAIYSPDGWKWTAPKSAPTSNWNQLEFDDNSWDNSKNKRVAVLPGENNPLTDLYMRTTFNVIDKSKIEKLAIATFFDDAIIVYINGIEVTRSFNVINTGFKQSPWTGYDTHSEVIDRLFVNKTKLEAALVNGTNVLAINTKNIDPLSSDLYNETHLIFGISDESRNYKPPLSFWNDPVVLSSSNLPIVIINTNGEFIDRDTKILADMQIINNGLGKRNRIDDLPNEYNDKIGIEYRGSSSLKDYPRKNYSIELRDAEGEDQDAPLLGMPTEEDWILYAPFADKTLMRNTLAYFMGNRLSEWAPNCRYVEVILNENYEGIYVLMERIKRDKHRVDIAKLDSDDILGHSLTGGYIVSLDRNTYQQWESDQGVTMAIAYPKKDIQPQQRDYIQNHINTFENVLAGSNFKDPEEGYRSYISVKSFIDYLFIQETSYNFDGYRLSAFMYKDKDRDKDGDGIFERAQIHMGPLWDFNIAFGNCDYGYGTSTEGFHYNKYDNSPSWGNVPFWWRRFFEDEAFVDRVNSRWQDKRQDELHTDTITTAIDSIARYLNEAQKRNFQQWPVLGVNIDPNPYWEDTYEKEVSRLKNWVVDRLNWIDTQFSDNNSDDASDNDSDDASEDDSDDASEDDSDDASEDDSDDASDNNLDDASDNNSDMVLSIDKDITDNSIMVYPNPSNKQFVISLSLPGTYQFEIRNTLGQLVLNKQFTGSTEVQIENWPEGLYIYRLQNEFGQILSGRFIKN